MKKDLNKGINITYNYLNLPTTITWNAKDLNDKRRIEWLYDATGSKLRKTVYNTDGEATMVTDYVNGFVYNTNYADALPQLSFFSMSEGRVVNLGGSYELQYWLKDHLANTRIAFHSGAGGTAEVLQKDFYYPFGLTFTFGNLIGDENKFKYNGKELEDEHGLYWYHYGARYYDPQLGRWHTIDPVDEFYSPYLFVGDNPVLFKDEGGKYSVGKSGTGCMTIHLHNAIEGTIKNIFPELKFINRDVFDSYGEIMYDISKDLLLNKTGKVAGVIGKLAETGERLEFFRTLAGYTEEKEWENWESTAASIMVTRHSDMVEYGYFDINKNFVKSYNSLVIKESYLKDHQNESLAKIESDFIAYFEQILKEINPNLFNEKANIGTGVIYRRPLDVTNGFNHTEIDNTYTPYKEIK